MTWLDEGDTTGGFGREDYFQYDSRFDELPGIRPVVRLEPGIQSGTFPTVVVPITSMIGQYLLKQGRGDMADDLMGFDMTLLHFRRTFVEKLFALHGKVVRLIDDGHPLERHARHYPDLYALAAEKEVRAMLASDEYEQIRTITTRPVEARSTSRGSIALLRIFRSPPVPHFSRTASYASGLLSTMRLSATFSSRPALTHPSTRC